ncbi:MAG: DnaJ domain-containing protein [Chlamydiota bacterium]|nr:DnaJ domain-containing protein [Chlamydiota bacterium]
MTVKFDPYKVLGFNIGETPTLKEVRQQFHKLSRKYHPDRNAHVDPEKFVKVNLAYEILSNPEKLEEYKFADFDEDYGWSGESPEFSIGCDPANLWSTHYKTLIASNRINGLKPSDRDVKIDHVTVDRIPLSLHTNGTEIQYKKLVGREVPIISETLAEVIPESVWKWRSSGTCSIPADSLEGDAWTTPDLPPEPLWSHHLLTLLDLAKRSSKSPKVEEPAIFKTNKLFIKSEKDWLINNTECTNCKKSFGYGEKRRFLWVSTFFNASNCVKCGFRYCNDCTTIHEIPGIKTLMIICPGCKPVNGLWGKKPKQLETLNPSKFLLHACASCGDFLERDRFKVIKPSNFSKEISVCDYCAKINLHEFNHYGYRKAYLENVPNLSEHKPVWRSQFPFKEHSPLKKIREFSEVSTHLKTMSDVLEEKEWIRNDGLKKADDFFKKGAFEALSSYNKLGLTSEEYKKRALDHPENPLSKSLLMIACSLLPTEDEKLKFLKETINNAVSQDKLQISQFCTLLYNLHENLPKSIEEWAKIINDVPIDNAEHLLVYFSAISEFYQSKLRLSPERDHLRWERLTSNTLDSWLSQLEKHLEEGGAPEGILYFRSKYKDVNFIVERDKYFEKKNYNKAFLCHRLSGSTLSWDDLAQKFQNSNPSASFASFLMKHEADPEKLFSEGKYRYALCKYFQNEEYGKVASKAKEAIDSRDYDTALMYQTALWHYLKYPSDTLIDICNTLLLIDRKKNLLPVQNLLIAAIKEGRNCNDLKFHRLLIKTDISNLEYLGLLNSVSTLNLNDDDLKWYDEAVKNYLNKFRQNFANIIRASAFKDLLAMLQWFSPLTLPVVHEFINRDFDSIADGPAKAMALMVRAVYVLADPEQDIPVKAMDDLSEAMISFPHDECIQTCSLIIQQLQRNSNGKWSLNVKELSELQYPIESRHTKKLKSNAMLRIIRVAEKSMKGFDPLDKAFSTIDLCMAINSPAGLAGGFLNAAIDLCKVQDSVSDDDVNSKFAYRKAIVSLVASAVDISRSYLCPTTQLYLLRSSISILMSAFKSFDKVSQREKKLFEGLQHQVKKLAELSPIIIDHAVGIFDLIFHDLMNSRYLEEYLPLETSKSQQNNPDYQYYHFEGLWSGWMDEGKSDFHTERVKSMDALLQEKKQTRNDVEYLMSWPVLERDTSGWLSDKPSPLNLGEASFSKVTGLELNITSGKITLLFDKSEDEMQQLFNMSDVEEIISRKITSASFTLDQPDNVHRYHPFQKMIFEPKVLSGTNHLGTLLHTDYLLKMLTTGTEVSAISPFDMRKDDNLLNRLPKKLSDELREVRESMRVTANTVNRFWIEAGDLPYTKNEAYDEGNEVITFNFGECEMSVKKHDMCYDENGELVDKEENDVTSPEAKLAAFMTKHFEEIGEAYPELLRLRELAKIQIIALFTLQTINRLYNEYESKQRCFPGNFIEQCKQFNMFEDFNKSIPQLPTDLVPATFNKEWSSGRVYGGVALAPNPRGVPNLGNSNGAPSQGNPHGAPKANCRVSLTSQGNLKYTASCVNTLTGEKINYMIIKNSASTGDTTMQSRYGGDTHHVTFHDRAGSLHVHGLNKQTTCYDSQGGSTVYKKGQGYHDCKEK